MPVNDGLSKVQEFNDLLLEGEHLTALDGKNTFVLSTPHTVAWGIGISFYFVASIALDNIQNQPRPVLSAAGGDFYV